MAEIIRLREIDLVAIRETIAAGERNGENATAVAAHRAWRAARAGVAGG